VIVCDASLGGTLARLDLNVALTGPQASAEPTGSFSPTARRTSTHAGRSSPSDGQPAGLPRHRGPARTRGLQHHGSLHPGAAERTHANRVATSCCRPAEIDGLSCRSTDDVQCAHSATTGQLDPQALFYLQSRGIERPEARRLLTRAFAASVLNRMKLPSYAAAVHELVDSRLRDLLEESVP
jgi:Fe-S cluster assembly protein SufD